MSQCISLNSQNRYEIKIYDQPDDSWLGWFGEETIVHTKTLADDVQVITFSNVIMDQVGLIGLIRRLHGIGIVLISIVGREPDDPSLSKDLQDTKQNNLEKK